MEDLKEFAIGLLKKWLTDSPRVTTVAAWRSRNKVSVDNLWLIIVEGRIVDATTQVSRALGLKFDPNSGGIRASAPWVTVHQVQQLSQTLGLEIDHDKL